MSNAKHDDNRVATLLGISNVDGVTPVSIYGDPATHELLIAGSFSVTGGATATGQTDGSQKTQLVDAGGEAATVTGGKLDVNASIDTTGLATSTKQDTGNTSLATIAGAVSATHVQVDVLTVPTVTVNAHAVTNAGTFAVQSTSIVPGVAATNLGKAEDAVHASGDTGIMALGVVNANYATMAAEGDYAPFQLDQYGRLFTFADSQGNVAHDGADSGNPIKIGGKATTSEPAAVANNDRVNAYFDANGYQHIKAGASLDGSGAPVIDSYTHLAINLAAAADQVLVASAANKQIWVYGVSFVVNVAGTVSFQDEDNLAITGIMPFAANSGLGIPTSGNFAMPIWKLATNKDLEVDVVTSEVDGWLDYAIVSV